MADDESTVGWNDPRWAEAGITPRQLDFWTRSGHLRCAGLQLPGSGRARTWPVSEMHVAVLVRRLLDRGLILSAAFELARDQQARIELAEVLVGAGAMA